MRRKREKPYTHKEAYADYILQIKDKATILPYDKWEKGLRLFMAKLNREIIVEKYEWKLPFFAGYLRISKNRKNGMFFFFWDKSNDYCRIPKRHLWSFKPVRGQFQNSLIGDYGLRRYYTECKNDRKRPDYNVPLIYHGFKIRE